VSSSQSNVRVIASVIVTTIIVVGFVGYGYYATSSSLASISRQNTSLSQQLSGVNAQASNLNQQVSNINQEISNLNQQVSALEQKTLMEVTMTDTVVTVETTTSLVTTTQTSISAVPQSALIIVADSYDNNTYTFTFQVENTQNYTIFAQINSQLSGDCGCGISGMGFFISQVYQLNPNSMTPVNYNLTLTSLNGNLNQSPSLITVDMLTGSGVVVSPTYTFQYPDSSLVP
jgi:hypothetical protein